MSDSAGSKLGFFLLGVGFGFVVGILVAPKSGSGSRDYLSKRADDGREFAQKKARELRERADQLIERGQDIAVRKRESLEAAVQLEANPQGPGKVPHD